MLTSKKVLTGNITFLSSLTGFTVFCYIYFRYDWNNLLSLLLCGALAGAMAWGWDHAIQSSGDEPKGWLASLSGPWWWALALANLGALTWLILWDWSFLNFAERVTLTLAGALLLAYLAWIEWAYKQKGRSVLFGVPGVLWFFVALLMFAQGIGTDNSRFQAPEHPSATDMLTGLAVLGFYILPFLWFFVDTLRRKDTLRALNLNQVIDHSQPVPDEAEQALLDLSSKFEADRMEAAKKLGRLPGSDDRIIKALITATNDEHQSVKRVAREALDAPQHQAFMQTRPEYQKYVKQA